MTLTEFLLARIAEDEATEASRFRPRLSTSTQFETTTYPAVGIVVLQTVDDAWDTRTISWREYQEEYCDPAPNERMLAECAAKRAIIEAAAWEHEINPSAYYACRALKLKADTWKVVKISEGKCNCGVTRRRNQILRPLAAVYATHPDYDESWRS